MKLVFSAIFFLLAVLVQVAHSSLTSLLPPPFLPGNFTSLLPLPPSSPLLSFLSLVDQHHSQLVLLLISSSLLLLLLHWINRPLNYFRRLEESGYVPDGKHSLETIAQQTRRRRQGGDTPPPFPNGWFFVINSDELKVGEVKQVCLLGQTVAVFRGEDEKAKVLDAYCPHMGANLAVGGIVKGCALQCPFHGWSFDGDGKCVEIPYSSSPIPSVAKTKAWETLEVNGQVLVWFDAEGREPFWKPRELAPIMSGNWTCKGRTEGYVNCHIQEVPENGADVAHLTFLHTPIILTGVDLRKTRRWMDIVSHHWTAQWAPLEEPNGHVGNLKLSHAVYLFGRHVPFLDFHVDAFQEGPGLVNLTWEFALGKGAFFQTLVPVEPMLQRVSHTVWADGWVPSFVCKLLLLAEVKQVERDMMIWNNKKFVSKPILVKEDKLIGQFRRWYSQFYSEHSKDYGQKNNLDW